MEEKLKELGDKGSANGLQKAQAGFNLFNQGANALNSLTQGNAAAQEEEGSSKRPMTAEEKARIYAFTANLEQSLNNGFGQINYNGQMLSSLNNNTTNTTSTTNPFSNLKKVEEQV